MLSVDGFVSARRWQADDGESFITLYEINSDIDTARGIGLVAPTRTVDVVANLIFAIPVMVLPFVLLWKAPGENRSRLALTDEFVMVYIPLTAGAN